MFVFVLFFCLFVSRLVGWLVSQFVVICVRKTINSFMLTIP